MNKELFNSDTYNDEIYFIYKNYFSTQEKYGFETNHSQLKEKQNEWRMHINEELEALGSSASKIYM